MNMIGDVPIFQAAVDKGFLSGVQRGFGSSGFGEFLSQAVLPLVLILLVVAIIGLAVKYIRIKRFLSDIPVESRVRRKDLVKILKNAQNTNCAFELRFFTGKEKRKPVMCTLSKIDTEALEFRVAGDVEPDKDWLERRIEAFFNLCGGQEDPMCFYMFSSRVLGVRGEADGSNVVLLKFPKEIPPYQKRHHLRIDPPYKYVLGLGIWQEKMRKEGKPEWNLKKWGKPPLTILPGKDNPVTIENISNTGMRLVIDREAADRSEIPFRIALQLIVLLDLHDPGTKKRLRFLTRSRVQNIYEGHKSKSMEVGVKFTDLGQLKKDGTYDVAWRNISDEGITALSDWVLRLFQDQEATVTVDRDGEDPAEEQEETQADA